MKTRPLIACLMLVSGVVAADVAVAESPVPPTQTSLVSYQLSQVEVRGVSRLTPAQVLHMAGLQPGRMVRTHDVDAASARLRETGLFSSVGHRYRMAARTLVVTFEVTEAPRDLPVTFDNFVDLPREVLLKAVDSVLPGFDGQVPISPAAISRATRAVENAVRRRIPAASVDATQVASSPEQPMHLRLQLRGGPAAPVCRVEFDGAPPWLLGEGRARGQWMIDTQYSVDYLERFVQVNLLVAARARGHLRARVTGVDGRRVQADAEGCRVQDVMATIGLDLGRSYTWRGVEWTGVSALPRATLASLIPLQDGAVADHGAFLRGLDAAQAAYRRLGYLAVQLVPQEHLDEVAGTVTYGVSVTEGARFRMGHLTVTGLEPELAERVRTLWRLAQGDFYDASYWLEFAKQVRDRERPALAGRTAITSREKPDESSRTVDVVLEFGK